MSDLDARLHRLRQELDDHARVAEHLGLDLERPLKALNDGYPETTVALVGTLCERLLKRLWEHHRIEGDPSGRALNELTKRCRPHIRSQAVVDALEDIRRLRNRAGHDGGPPISDEDGLTAVRRLVDILAWFADTGSAALLGDAPRLVPEVALRSEFLAGLYVTLGYRSAKRFVLTRDTVYQLFCRESGARLEYVELLLSRDADDLRQVLTTTGGELLRTRLPKRTRLVVLDEAHDALRQVLGDEFRIIRYDSFISTLFDFDAHLPEPPRLAPGVRISAAVLAADPQSGQAKLQPEERAETVLARLVQDRANVLLIGRPGSGKSTLLRALVNESGPRHLRFFFDLSVKQRDESLMEYVARKLAPCMKSDRERAWDLFLFLIRSGSALCVLDAVDEGISETSPRGFLHMFAELSTILSAESAVVMSSRVSFLADSPQIRQLLSQGAARSEQLVEHLYAHGVDPERVPHCHLVRLTGTGPTPLERRLTATVRPVDNESFTELLGEHLTQVLSEAGAGHLLPRLPAAFGAAFLAGRTTFTLIELHRMLGADAFRGGNLNFEHHVLWPLLRTAGSDRITFLHTAYQELLAARYLATSEGRDAASSLAGEAFLTEQLRFFLARTPEASEKSDDGLLPSGVYLVGPAERLLLRRVHRPVLFDRYPVTVGRYRRFLAALRPDGTSNWDHPAQPDHVRHTPWVDRLRDATYYRDARFEKYPAVCVSWWSAYAFAAFEGKRLPTSLEWEAAARGTDGRLFPWGDDADGARVNCADTWVGRPLASHQDWQRLFAQDAVHRAGTTPVDDRPDNRSPYGLVDMAGQVWEWTATSLSDPGEAVICGGSYDNPLRGVRTSSKGLYRKRGGSNAVGFRCVIDLAGASQSSDQAPEIP